MCPIFADALQLRQARIKRGLCAMCGGAAGRRGASCAGAVCSCGGAYRGLGGAF